MAVGEGIVEGIHAENERLRNENEALRALLTGLANQIDKHTGNLVDVATRTLNAADSWITAGHKG